MGVAKRQQHAVVEFISDGFGPEFKRDEVEHVLVGIEVAFDFDGGAIIMAMQSFTLVTFVADEMPGAENQVVFGDTNFVVLGHDRKSAGQWNGVSGSILPSRNKMNKEAVTRSAVMPGLRLFPRARSQESNFLNAVQPAFSLGQPSSRIRWAERVAFSASANPLFRAMRLSGFELRSPSWQLTIATASDSTRSRLFCKSG